MSGNFEETRSAWARLKIALANADENTRIDFGYWCVGLALITVSVVAEFGWHGFGFLLGLAIWRTGKNGLIARTEALEEKHHDQNR